MKRYCLSDCAKRKLNAGKEALVRFISVVLLAIVIFAGFALLFLIVGFIVQGGYYLIFGNLIGLFERNIFGLGAIVTVLGSFGAMVLTIIGYFIYGVYVFIKNIVANKLVSDSDYYYDYHDCKIFEECKD